MPIRKSEAYDDPLRTQSVRGHDNVALPDKIEQEKFLEVEEAHIEWSNLIFLPFHSVFNMFVLVAVVIKAILVILLFIYLFVGGNLDRYQILASRITNLQ